MTRFDWLRKRHAASRDRSILRIPVSHLSSEEAMQMLPNYLLDEATIRESGESAVLDLRDETNQSLLFTLGITHAVEQESLNVDVFGSHDGVNWTPKPILNFPKKFYCGTYQALLPKNDFRYLKACWRVDRWGRGDLRPFFRIYVLAQTSRVRALAAA